MKSAGQIIIDNLARVRERIEEATLAAHRAPGEVTLIAVSKYVGLTESAALLEASCLDLGESRPQQLWEKASSQSLSDARWHLVGHLQRNKVRRTLPLTDVIHSVDSLRLLAAINGVAAELELRPRLLLEVNATGEAQKHGLSAGELSATLEAAEGFSNVRIVGLMAMAPRNGGVDAARKCFAEVRQLRDEFRTGWPEHVELKELSMGMSRDFPEAIGEGATMVRVGSTLFEGVI